MPNPSGEQARLELMARQGVGARYDAQEAPAETLRWARWGTAYLARRINELSDLQLDDGGQNGRPRRLVIAQVAVEARAFSHLLEGVRMGAPRSLAESLALFQADIADATTLPAHALRYLFKHSEVHLNVEWRDLPGPGWATELVGADGGTTRMDETVLFRARTVWSAAIELANGGRFSDIPQGLLVALQNHAGGGRTSRMDATGLGGHSDRLLGLDLEH